VTFTASVAAGTTPITYTWNFGDGGTAITTATVIQHLYPLANTLQNYTATLTAANACSSQATQKPIVVRPYGIYLPAVMRTP
jgi:PKD repeat protein